MKEWTKNPLITVLIRNFVFGGLQRVMITLTNGLKRRGFNVRVVTFNATGPLRDTLDDKIHVRDFAVPNVRYRNSLIPLIRFFERDDSDVFISSLFNEPVMFAHALTRSKSKMILTIHGSARNEIKVERRKFARITASLFSRILYKRADAIVAVSNGVKDEILIDKSIDPNKVHVIYNPVITGDYSAMINEPTGHPWLDDRAFPIIMSVGRLYASKGNDVLIRAFHILKKEVNARLMIIGDGEEMANLKSLTKELDLENDVLFAGFQKNPFAFMAKADLVALASRTEGFPLILAEAMFCGASVVSTDCPSGPREILEDGRYGALVKVDDVQGLADAIKHALGHPTDKETLRRRSLEFSEDAALDKYVSLLTKIVE